MIQKLASGSLGLLLLASPVLVSADTLSDLQAQLQSLLFTLQQLQVASSATISQTFTASPASGTAPLSVAFQERTASGAGSFAVDFGDGTGIGTTICNPLAGSNDSVCSVTHAYTMPGVYYAELIGKGAGDGSQWQGTGKRVMFRVRNASKTGASATIDQHSMISNSSNPTISGTASNADIEIRIKKGRVTIPSPIGTSSQTDVWRNANVLPVAGGHWSAQVASVKLENGYYTVVVSHRKTGYVLATSVLLVDTVQ